jgi:hypothetical protein
LSFNTLNSIKSVVFKEAKPIPLFCREANARSAKPPEREKSSPGPQARS